MGEHGTELVQLLIPYFSLGLIVAGIFLFISTLRFFPERKYMSVLLITLVSFAYILLEIKIRSLLMHNAGVEKVWVHIYLQNLFRLLYLPAVPLFLHEFILVSPLANRIHRILLTLMSLLCLFILILALFWKKAYLDSDMVYFSMGEYGPVIRIVPHFWFYVVSITLLGLVVYSLIATFISSFIPRFNRNFLFLFLGILFASYFYISALGLELWGSYLPPLKNVPYSRMSVGLGVMTFFIYLGIFRIFLGHAKDTVETERRLNQEQVNLIKMAYTDETTQIPNRTAFLRDLEQLLKRKNPKAAVMFMDLNQFLNINISYGPVLADQFLRILAQRFIANLPESARIYRVEGDEFGLIIHPLQSENVPEEIAILLHGWMNQGVSIDGETYRLTAAIGNALIPDHGIKLLDILRNSRRALMEAKQKKIPFATFKPEKKTSAELRINAVRAIRQAIKESRFHLVYQPVVDAGKKITGAEVLVRWETEMELFKKSSVFIPIAEKAGLMGQLGDIIIECFITDYSDLKTFAPDLLFSLNISGTQFFSREICDNLIFQLSRSGVSMTNLQFEIPESLLLPALENYQDVLDKFRGNGIKIAIDDFASHCLNMNSFTRLPLDSIKVDMSFLEKIPDSSQSRELLKSVLNMGKILNLSIVSKGIQNEDQFHFLRENGCQYFQGYHFYHPLRKEAFYQLLKEKENE